MNADDCNEATTMVADMGASVATMAGPRTMAKAALGVRQGGSQRRPRAIAAQVVPGDAAGRFEARCPPGWTKAEWIERLRQAFGTTSGAFLAVSVQRLINACALPGYAVANSTTLAAALTLVEALAPADEVQGALAVHIAALDAAAANTLARMTRDSGPFSTTFRSNALAKLERAFVAALTTYQRLKYGNRQVIRIEKVEVQAGAQAVVGQLVASPSMRGR